VVRISRYYFLYLCLYILFACDLARAQYYEFDTGASYWITEKLEDLQEDFLRLDQAQDLTMGHAKSPFDQFREKQQRAAREIANFRFGSKENEDKKVFTSALDTLMSILYSPNCLGGVEQEYLETLDIKGLLGGFTDRARTCSFSKNQLNSLKQSLDQLGDFRRSNVLQVPLVSRTPMKFIIHGMSKSVAEAFFI
jgi:hypothetical protein